MLGCRVLLFLICCCWLSDCRCMLSGVINVRNVGSPVQRVSVVYEESLVGRYPAADRRKLAARQQGLLLH
jgi:hypothetical protein